MRSRLPRHLGLLTWAGTFFFLTFASRPGVARPEEALSDAPRKLPASSVGDGGVDLPLAFYERTGFVSVTVNGKPRTFLVDTASLTVVNGDRLDLPLVRSSTARAVTAAGPALLRWKLVRAERLTVGGKSFTGLRLMAKSLRDLEQAFGREVDGILGNDVLMRWDSVKIDYKNGRLVLQGESDEQPVYSVSTGP